MIPADSLLKYNTPVVVSKRTRSKSPRRERPYRGSHRRQASYCSPKPKPATPATLKQQNDDMLNVIFPPRKWMDGNKLWIQQVSSVPCSGKDVIHLQELLDRNLQQKQAKETGICPIRRELYSQCFDELVRQVTITCAERGEVLWKVRNEMQTTFDAYQQLYESCMAYSMKKVIKLKRDKADKEKKMLDQEEEIKELKNQLERKKNECDEIKKTEYERQQEKKKKNAEEAEVLLGVIEQLKGKLTAEIKKRT